MSITGWLVRNERPMSPWSSAIAYAPARSRTGLLSPSASLIWFCCSTVMTFWVIDAWTTSPGISWKMKKISIAVANRTGIVKRMRFRT